MKKLRGFTLLEIMIVVAIIGLLAAISIPSFMKARNTSQAKTCINNLRQIESGKEQWAMATGAAVGTDANSTSNRPAVNQYLKLQSTGPGTNGPVCSIAGAVYDYRGIGTNATCSASNTLNDLDASAWHILP